MAYSFVWTKNKIDLTELASKRWVERWSINKITAHFGFGRTFIVRKLGQLRRNPDLIQFNFSNLGILKIMKHILLIFLFSPLICLGQTSDSLV